MIAAPPPPNPPPPNPPTVLVRQAAVRPAVVRPLTAILGVLRRPQTTADRDPLLLWHLAEHSRDPITAGLWGSPVVSLVRRAAVTSWGQRIFLTAYLPPTRRQRATLPAKLRDVAVARQPSVMFSPLSSGQMTAAVIEGGRAWDSEGEPDVDAAGNRFVFLFPDGVAKVALSNATSIATHPRPLVARHSPPVLVSVRDNVAAFASRTFHSPGREVWYGPSGRIVRRIANASSCAPPLGACC